MNCADFQLQLSEFIDGEMSSVIRKDFLQHKNDCPDCAEVLVQFKSAVTALHGLPRQKVSPDFNEKLRARISAEAHPSLWSRIQGFFPPTVIPKVAVTAVAASMIAVFSYSMLKDPAVATQASQNYVMPPPALNMQQSEPLRSPVAPGNQIATSRGINQEAGAQSVAETVDSNQARPANRRSFEGQIKYVNEEK